MLQQVQDLDYGQDREAKRVNKSMMRDIREAMKDMYSAEGATSVTTYGAAIIAAIATLAF